MDCAVTRHKARRPGARLNCIHHLLAQIPYTEVEHPAIVLPPRERHDDYVRRPVPHEILVPGVY